jgi:hypothetical protein
MQKFILLHNSVKGSLLLLTQCAHFHVSSLLAWQACTWWLYAVCFLHKFVSRSSFKTNHKLINNQHENEAIGSKVDKHMRKCLPRTQAQRRHGVLLLAWPLRGTRGLIFRFFSPLVCRPTCTNQSAWVRGRENAIYKLDIACVAGGLPRLANFRCPRPKGWPLKPPATEANWT